MELTEDNIAFIQQDIRHRGLDLNGLTDSVVDHVCCAIEVHPGTDFNKVYAEVISAFGENGILKIQEDTILLLTLKKTEKMKKTMYVIGFLAAFLSSTGLLFKLMHWQGASIMLVLGVVFINFGFLPMYFYDKYKSSVQ